MKRVPTAGSTKITSSKENVSVANRLVRNKLQSSSLCGTMGLSAAATNDPKAVTKPSFAFGRRAALGDIKNRVANTSNISTANDVVKKEQTIPDVVKRRTAAVDSKRTKPSVAVVNSNLVCQPEPRRPLRSTVSSLGSLATTHSSKTALVSGVASKPATALTRHVTATSIITTADIHGPPKQPTKSNVVVRSQSTSSTVFPRNIALRRKPTITTSTNEDASKKSTDAEQSSSNVPTQDFVSVQTETVAVIASSIAVLDEEDAEIKEIEEQLLPLTDDKGPLKCSEAYSQSMIPDIDSEDKNFPQMASEFVNEIYHYLRYLERQQSVKPDFLHGTDISGRMRAILIDWLVQVHVRFHLLPETLYMTVCLIDRFLQVSKVYKEQLQLVGLTALFIASKYEEIYAPEIGDFIYISDNTYTKEQLRKMERLMLRKLDFNVGRPLAIHFLRRYSKAAEADDVGHSLSKFLLELTFTEYTMTHIVPSLVAAASTWLSMKMLNSQTSWSPVLKHYTTYKEEEVFMVAKKLCDVIIKVYDKGSKFQAVRAKFTTKKFLGISNHSSLKSPVIRDIVAFVNLEQFFDKYPSPTQPAVSETTVAKS